MLVMMALRAGTCIKLDVDGVEIMVRQGKEQVAAELVAAPGMGRGQLFRFLETVRDFKIYDFESLDLELPDNMETDAYISSDGFIVVINGRNKWVFPDMSHAIAWTAKNCQDYPEISSALLRV